MSPPASLPSSDRALIVRVSIGALVGVLYAVVNDELDAMWLQGRLEGPLRALHGGVDQAIPVITGALVGVALHFVSVRSWIAAEAQRRASDLRSRLHRVEREQAAWVVAAATLHEVRNPLHALGLVFDELAAVIPESDTEATSLLSTAQQQLDRVGANLTKLRELAEAGQPELAPLPLAPVLERLITELADPKQVRIEVNIEPELTARADASYVRIIVENLIDNALDAIMQSPRAGRSAGGPSQSLPRGTICVSARREGDEAVIGVQDDGPGIAPELADSLFEPLRTSKARGLGLGLSIGRALARSMHGDLLLATGTSGTTFNLHLPLR